MSEASDLIKYNDKYSYKVTQLYCNDRLVEVWLNSDLKESHVEGSWRVEPSDNVSDEEAVRRVILHVEGYREIACGPFTIYLTYSCLMNAYTYMIYGSDNDDDVLFEGYESASLEEAFDEATNALFNFLQEGQNELDKILASKTSLL